MKIFASLRRLLPRTQGKASVSTAIVPMSSTHQLQCLEKTGTERKQIFLNGALPRADEDLHVVVLGAAGVKKDNEVVVQKLKNGRQMHINVDGSFIVTNEQSLIIRTGDVLNVRRDYSRDENGELLIKHLGIWTKLENGRLDEDGTLFYTRGCMKIEERINGLHIHTNEEQGVSIQWHHHNKFEIIKLPNHEIWKRQTTKEQETFAIWKNGRLCFKSETHFATKRVIAATPNGQQPLINVSRTEQSWQSGVLTREKYTFQTGTTRDRTVNIQLHLCSGIFLMKRVMSVTTLFTDGEPTETVYQFIKPSSIKIDIPTARKTLANIVRIRNFIVGGNFGLALEAVGGEEYIVFVGAVGREARQKQSQVHGELEHQMGAGEMPADLVLR